MPKETKPRRSNRLCAVKTAPSRGRPPLTYAVKSAPQRGRPVPTDKPTKTPTVDNKRRPVHEQISVLELLTDIKTGKRPNPITDPRIVDSYKQVETVTTLSVEEVYVSEAISPEISSTAMIKGPLIISYYPHRQTPSVLSAIRAHKDNSDMITAMQISRVMLQTDALRRDAEIEAADIDESMPATSDDEETQLPEQPLDGEHDMDAMIDAYAASIDNKL